jgi:acetyl-CoA carboxylase carboxyl transferase subunit beta
MRENAQAISVPDSCAASQRAAAVLVADILANVQMAAYPLVLAVLDFPFIGGTPGPLVGEKVTQAVTLACEHHLPLFIVLPSGVQVPPEGMVARRHLANVSVALSPLSAAHAPVISLLTDPSPGGVAASCALILAEPGAVVGFGGPRGIAQCMQQRLPEDADISESVTIAVGAARSEIRSTRLRLLPYDNKSDMGAQKRENQRPGAFSQMHRMPERACGPQPLRSWDQVQLARPEERPSAADAIRLIRESVLEVPAAEEGAHLDHTAESAFLAKYLALA